MPSSLRDDTAPSASLDHLEALAAPTHPRAPPGPLGSSPPPPQLASGWPKRRLKVGPKVGKRRRPFTLQRAGPADGARLRHLGRRGALLLPRLRAAGAISPHPPNLPCISPASPLHLLCISSASPLHLICISSATTLQLPCISPASRASTSSRCKHRLDLASISPRSRLDLAVATSRFLPRPRRVCLIWFPRGRRPQMSPFS